MIKKLRKKSFFLTLAIIFYFIGVILYSSLNYLNEKERLMADIDLRLKRGALGIISVLGSQFHENIFENKKISDKEDYENILRLSYYAEVNGLKYVYSMIKKEGKIYFTSSSATDDEIKGKNYSTFMQEYHEATKENILAFENLSEFYEVSSDRWGEFRSILVPIKSQNGEVYIVGADITTEHINSLLKESLWNSFKTAITFLGLISPLVFVYIYWAKKERKLLEEEIQERTIEITELNLYLEKRVEDEVELNRQKDIILMKQSGFAAMGEMIGNIAHQWRQPINAIGLIIQDIQDAFEYGELDDKYIDKQVKKSMHLVNFMSQTINDFRNFFKPDKEKVSFKMAASAEKALSVADTTIKNAEIEVILNMDEYVEVKGFPNEFAQVVLNILNNAKDVLVEREIKKPKIEINVFEEKGKGILTIKDNAGGIPKDLLDKIFLAYFTTKNSFKGTGLGLYISKSIIEQNMGGKLSVENNGDGALFKIEINDLVTKKVL